MLVVPIYNIIYSAQWLMLSLLINLYRYTYYVQVQNWVDMMDMSVALKIVQICEQARPGVFFKNKNRPRVHIISI